MLARLRGPAGRVRRGSLTHAACLLAPPAIREPLLAVQAAVFGQQPALLQLAVEHVVSRTEGSRAEAGLGRTAASGAFGYPGEKPDEIASRDTASLDRMRGRQGDSRHATRKNAGTVIRFRGTSRSSRYA